MLLAQGSVFFRDIQYIYNAVITAWMYLTPMFYPITLLPDSLRKLVMTLNPMYFLYYRIPADCIGMPDAGCIFNGSRNRSSSFDDCNWNLGIPENTGQVYSVHLVRKHYGSRKGFCN